LKVTRHGKRLHVRLSLAEAHVLDEIFRELQGELEPDALDPSDPVHRRLYPAAYESDEDDAAYRELTEPGLRAERAERVGQCLAELVRARSLVRTDVQLDADAADRWIRVLNDLRLSSGTRLEITEEDDYELRSSDPDIQLRARYVWLTALQDMLVTALME
jgi:hypothetical protein